MPAPSRLIALGSSLVIVVICAILWLVSPIHISVSFDRDDGSAAAAPARSIDATATPAPPTATPPPTATAAPAVAPTNTPLVAINTPDSTATPAESTAVPPTATPKPRTTGKEDDPMLRPTATATVLPTATPAPEQPNVSIAKSVDRSTVKAGETVVFSLVAKNTSSSIAHDVVVSDVVPAVFQVTDLSSTKGDVVVDGQSVTAYPATLAPNETITILITAKVKPDAAAGQYRNTALITTSTANDNPGDNTSTVTITIEQPPVQKQAPPAQKPPLQQQSSPPNLPRTADPDAPTFLLVWGPWIMLALFLAMFGGMVRVGMFRTRFVRVSLTPVSRAAFRSWDAAETPAPLMPPAQVEPITVEGIELDALSLVQRWQEGISVGQLANEIAAENPTINQLIISLAVQRIIDEQLN